MGEIYSNDVNAPRMRKAQFSKMVITKDLFKKFLNDFPEHKGMTWSIFYKSWLDIAEKIRYEAVNNPLGVKMGSYIGEIKVQYIPYKMDIPNIAASKEAGEKILHFNFESKGKPARVKWERRAAARFNKVLQFYAFDETRELTIAAGKHISENPNSIRVSRVTVGGQVNIWTQKR